VNAATGAVHVWHVGLDLPPAVGAAYEEVLSPDERARRESYAGDRQRRAYHAVRGALRVILGAYLDVPPAAVRLRTGRWGKPEVDGGGPRFSLSHAGRVVLLAVTRDRAVGVDVERTQPGRPVTALAARYFPAAEGAAVAAAPPAQRSTVYLRLWTRKEACVKAAGARLAYGMPLPVAGAGPAVRVADPTGRLPGPWLVRDLDAPPGYAASVALAGTAPYAVSVHRFRAAHVHRVLAAGGTLADWRP
jgi:4'-phosphopantetheinyl transferase